jgi:ATP-dependent DNA ligase
LPASRRPIFSRLMKINPLPSGFVIPAQPVKASRPPSGPDWVHEIKHDGYRIIIRRDGPNVRLYSRNAYDWTARLSAITSAAERIKAKSFTIDGEAVVEIAQILAIILDQVEGVEDCGPCCLSAAQLVEP